jgi:hypothetical protein
MIKNPTRYLFWFLQCKQCHKIVLGTQSDVFETMFMNMDLNEAKSGEVEIEDFDFDTVETSSMDLA